MLSCGHVSGVRQARWHLVWKSPVRSIWGERAQDRLQFSYWAIYMCVSYTHAYGHVEEMKRIRTFVYLCSFCLVSCAGIVKARCFLANVKRRIKYSVTGSSLFSSPRATQHFFRLFDHKKHRKLVQYGVKFNNSSSWLRIKEKTVNSLDPNKRWISSRKFLRLEILQTNLKRSRKRGWDDGSWIRVRPVRVVIFWFHAAEGWWMNGVKLRLLFSRHSLDRYSIQNYFVLFHSSCSSFFLY